MLNRYLLTPLAAVLPAAPRRAHARDGAAGPFSNTASSSGAPGFTTFSFTPGTVIDNNQAYFLVINANSDSSAIGAIRISYTLTQAE